jgi:hypothetical protein
VQTAIIHAACRATHQRDSRVIIMSHVVRRESVPGAGREAAAGARFRRLSSSARSHEDPRSKRFTAGEDGSRSAQDTASRYKTRRRASRKAQGAPGPEAGTWCRNWRGAARKARTRVRRGGVASGRRTDMVQAHTKQPAGFDWGPVSAGESQPIRRPRTTLPAEAARSQQELPRFRRFKLLKGFDLRRNFPPLAISVSNTGYVSRIN